jgi:hypothetical protein
MKTNELNGAVLDLAVAKCEGVPLIAGCLFTKNPDDGAHYSPSTNWAQGGPIIERECMQLWKGGEWCASLDQSFNPPEFSTGTTPLIAAMRCYVASKLGDNVELPEGIQ